MKYLGIVVTLLLCGLLGYSNSQQELPSAEDVLKNLSGAGVDTNGLNASSISVEEAVNLFKKKCEKNAGPGVFENVTKAQEELITCATSLINVTKFKADMEKYKPTGDLDIVFREYCKKTPIARGCMTNFTDALEPCLEAQEREDKKIILNITDSLLDFVCYKEGDRIALFISAGGPECFQDKQLELQQCANTTFSNHVSSTSGLPGIENLPTLKFDGQTCSEIVQLQNCAVKVLEKCSDPTPANIVDSIFNFILKVTPCQNMLYAERVTAGEKSSASTISLSILSIAAVFLHFL